jgi:hypothetical protein
MDNNVEFFLYGEIIHHSIHNAPCMLPQLVEEYEPFMDFHVYRHHMYIKSRKDPQKEWVQMKYKIAREDI